MATKPEAELGVLAIKARYQGAQHQGAIEGVFAKTFKEIRDQRITIDPIHGNPPDDEYCVLVFYNRTVPNMSAAWNNVKIIWRQAHPMTL